MRKFLSVAVISVLFAACADDPSILFEPEVSRTIIVNGNDPLGPGCPPDPSCLAPIDAQIKILYDRNNALSRPGDGTVNLVFHGEADYAPASRANDNLATIWLTSEMSATQAINLLNRYINAVNGNGFSECASAELTARAQWIIGIIEASVQSGFTPALVSNPPTIRCNLSPVIPSATGSVATGVTLTWSDPFGFQTHYEVEKQTALNTWVSLGNVTLATITDPSANVAGATYTFRVRQCGSVGVGCGEWTEVTITIPGTGNGGGGEIGDCHKNQTGNGHTAHGNGKGKGHDKCDKKNK